MDYSRCATMNATFVFKEYCMGFQNKRIYLIVGISEISFFPVTTSFSDKDTVE